MNVSKNIITLTLNPSIDHILTVDTVTPYNKNILTGKQLFYGGKGVNTAFTLGKLGIPATAAGLIGAQDLAGLENKLSDVSIHNMFVPINGTTRSAYKIMETATNRDTEFNQDGTRVPKKDLEKLESSFNKLLNTHHWLALCGSIPAGIPDNFYASLIEKCKPLGIITCLDSSGKSLIQGVRAIPDILRINQSELKEILAREITSTPETVSAIKTLQETGVGKVVVSMGAEGTLGYDGENMWQVRVPQVEIRGLTGAGDAMTAGLIASFSQGKSFTESLRFSSALATASTLEMEPGDFDHDNLEDILGETTVQEITF
jgi:1-phosphofructokinase family hexose kinase